VEEPAEHIEHTRQRLRAWAERVRDGASEEEFVRAAERELEEAADRETAAAYTQAGPLWQSYAGLVRYFAKKGQAAAGPAATV
jgi:ferric-dicitrate binding protein FerR (iron transport regulator)